jgi:hypothetical protein
MANNPSREVLSSSFHEQFYSLHIVGNVFIFFACEIYDGQVRAGINEWRRTDEYMLRWLACLEKWQVQDWERLSLERSPSLQQYYAPMEMAQAA